MSNSPSPNGILEFGWHWIIQCLIACQHQVFMWNNVAYHSCHPMVMTHWQLSLKTAHKCLMQKRCNSFINALELSIVYNKPFVITAYSVFGSHTPRKWCFWSLYNEVYWFNFISPSVHLSIRLSICLSCILCPLCSTYSSGWIRFIFIISSSNFRMCVACKVVCKFFF